MPDTQPTNPSRPSYYLPKCPICRRLTVENVEKDYIGGHRHCNNVQCSWVVCKCNTLYDNEGRHYPCNRTTT